MKRVRITNILYWGFVVLVFVLATVGYMMAEEPWYDGAYHAAQLFVMEYSAPKSNNLLIYVCRVLCPVMTVTGLAALVHNLFKAVSDGVVSHMEDATAIYYDKEQMEELAKGFNNPVLMKDVVNKNAKNHVLLFENDVDNLKFYEQMTKYLDEDSKVYIKLEKIESRLLKKSDVYYFNINEIIARTYWQERNLRNHYRNGELRVKIGIIGFDALGQNMLDYGLMNNIYSLKQNIEYHIWGESCLYRNLQGDFDKMNRDTITYHNLDWKEELDFLKNLDRIIVVQEPDLDLLQALLYLNSDAEIDFYNPHGVELEDAYIGDKLKSFGILQNILNQENIMTDKLYRTAKEINYDYVVKSGKPQVYIGELTESEKMEVEWRALNGFVKGSNVACADYHAIRSVVIEALGWDKKNLTDKQRAMLEEMEHVRWCRYHYVNHWRYNKTRNNDKRMHNLLKPARELLGKDSKKDASVIQQYLESDKGTN